MTLHSKALGSFDNWQRIISSEAENGYNCFHFTPVQQYGISNSLYSLKNHNNIANQYCAHNSDINYNKKLKILKSTIQNVQQNLNSLCLIDIVVNHASVNSDIVLTDLDSTFNTINSPHLTLAWQIDRKLKQFTALFVRNQIQECSFSPYIKRVEDLNAVISAIQKRVFVPFKVQEYFMIDENKSMKQFQLFYSQLSLLSISDSINKCKEIISKSQPSKQSKIVTNTSQQINAFITQKINSRQGEGRFLTSIDQELAAALYFLYNISNKTANSQHLFKQYLINYNKQAVSKANYYVDQAIQAIRNQLFFRTITCNCNKINLQKNQLSQSQFSTQKFAIQGQKVVEVGIACNGFIWGGSGVQDFTAKGKWLYLRRKIIPWGDCSKLRYGNSYKDSPYLWQYMTNYVVSMAQIFDGFRLDNSHSTPLHVAQYLLSKARQIRPNLIVIAQFFSDSNQIEAQATARLGLTYLIRELKDQKNVHMVAGFLGHHANMGREVQISTCRMLRREDTGENDFVYMGGGDITKRKELIPQLPNALVFDVTHDNPAFLSVNPVYRALPLIGMNSFCKVAIGTTKGFDEFVDKGLNVVNEHRKYKIKGLDQVEVDDQEEEEEECVHIEVVFILPDAKWQFEKVVVACEESNWSPQIELAFDQNYQNQVFVDDEDDQENNSKGAWISQKQYFVRNINNKFFQYKFVCDETWRVNQNLPTVQNEGFFVNNITSEDNTRVIQIINRKRDLTSARKTLNQFHFINNSSFNNNGSSLIQHNHDIVQITHPILVDNRIHGYNVLVARMSQNRQNISDYQINLPGVDCQIKLISTTLQETKKKLHLQSLNNYYNSQIQASYVQYQDKASQVIHISTQGQNTKLKFTNIQQKGFIAVFQLKQSAFNKIPQLEQSINCINAKLVQNIHPALVNHILYRCEQQEKQFSRATLGFERGIYRFNNSFCDSQIVYAGVSSLTRIIRHYLRYRQESNPVFSNIREGDWLMDYIVQRFGDFIQVDNCNAQLNRIREQVRKCFTLIKSLSSRLKPYYLACVLFKLQESIWSDVFKQFTSSSSNIQKQFFTELFISLFKSIFQFYGNIPSCYYREYKFSLSAGLPHFTSGWARCWGRDTFIAFKGLFLNTKYYKIARSLLLQYASVNRHGGLIPNLLDSGNYTRFNARDATWFWLNSIKDYAEMVDFQIFNEVVDLQFPQIADQKRIKISDLVQKIMQSHVTGIHFREMNAGPKIDQCMRDEGFNISIEFDDATGMCYGGNKCNCGTWMDKMGQSEKANNRGIPATPRNGAAIELIGIQAGIVQFLSKVCEFKSQYFKYKGVKNKDGKMLQYKQWSDLLQQHFQKIFWISQNGYYKDTWGQVSEETDCKRDFNLRPNQCIALALGPIRMIQKQNAITCLELIQSQLLGKNHLGIKTLSPKDPLYRGTYDNSNDSNDKTIAKGWNYHNGPQWIWPIGYFIIAKLRFNTQKTNNQRKREMIKLISAHKHHLKNDPWMSLPELMNQNNSYCFDSCRAQAWSIGTISHVEYLLSGLQSLQYFIDNQAEGFFSEKSCFSSCVEASLLKQRTFSQLETAPREETAFSEEYTDQTFVNKECKESLRVQEQNTNDFSPVHVRQTIDISDGDVTDQDGDVADQDMNPKQACNCQQPAVLAMRRGVVKCFQKEQLVGRPVKHSQGEQKLYSIVKYLKSYGIQPSRKFNQFLIEAMTGVFPSYGWARRFQERYENIKDALTPSNQLEYNQALQLVFRKYIKQSQAKKKIEGLFVKSNTLEIE